MNEKMAEIEILKLQNFTDIIQLLDSLTCSELAEFNKKFQEKYTIISKYHKLGSFFEPE
jgi:hypothetical protein